jgi:hypothetical protein
VDKFVQPRGLRMPIRRIANKTFGLWTLQQSERLGRACVRSALPSRDITSGPSRATIAVNTAARGYRDVRYEEAPTLRPGDERYGLVKIRLLCVHQERRGPVRTGCRGGGYPTTAALPAATSTSDETNRRQRKAIVEGVLAINYTSVDIMSNCTLLQRPGARASR